MQIRFHRKFKKLYKKQPKKVQQKFNTTLEIFLKDPFDNRLNNHSLTGVLKQYHSIDITGDIRVWYMLDKENVITFIKIGSHSELYG